jgi:hypothetical protein
MPLQNRVDPFGRVLVSAARGLFTGNRGIIHDPATRSLLKKRWSTPHWIICVCKYKDRKPRDVMGYNRPGFVDKAGWTELFFLDEVTALAAGHRPCFTCRPAEARDYARGFSEVFRESGHRVADIDRRLHAERLASGGTPPTISGVELRKLPAGTMVGIGDRPYAIKANRLLPWSFDGYQPPIATSDRPGFPIVLLTPLTSIEVLRAGYRPVWHPSIGP